MTNGEIAVVAQTLAAMGAVLCLVATMPTDDDTRLGFIISCIICFLGAILAACIYWGTQI